MTVCCRCNFRRQDKALDAFIAVLKAEGSLRRGAIARVVRQIAKAIDRDAGAAELRSINRAKRAAKAA